MAKIHFKYGAMNSGKTDTLIKTAHNYEERELNVVVIKPEIDTKGGTTITARGGHSREVDILADRELDLRHEIGKRSLIACVLVDEAQFLTPDQNISALLRRQRGRHIGHLLRSTDRFPHPAIPWQPASI